MSPQLIVFFFRNCKRIRQTDLTDGGIMKYGLQKLTLLDFPGRVACTVFTPGCDFRCPFCHNASLVGCGPEDGEMSAEEILAFLRKREGILDGVAVTGGEPLLHEEIFDLLRGVRELGYAVKLDTNGSFPDRLKYAVENGLADCVAMDIKKAPEKYLQTAGVGNPGLTDKVRESADFLMRGALPFEFRTTVVKGFHEKEDFEAIGKWIEGTERYFLQKFVDSGDILGSVPGMGPVSDGEMREFLAVVRKYVPGAQLRGMTE